MNMTIKNQLHQYASPSRKKANEQFFKTGKGQYSEGDKFRGVSMPDIRKVAKANKDANFSKIQKLLDSPIHEERMCGLVILVYKYKTSNEKRKKQIFNFYIKNRKAINNWDLVDVTTPNIVGDYLFDKDKKLLYKYAKSTSLWERRIAILATFAFIRKNEFKDTLTISKILLKDKEDLIHKAVGWMLREIWKRDNKVVENFLQKNYSQIPRTTLRYSIERMPEKKRKNYLDGKI